ncbi:hypothetical protein ES708_04050 [subsurface metagenome]
MRCNFWIFTFLFVCGLIFETGCQAGAVQKSASEPAAAEQQAVISENIQQTVADANEPAPKIAFDNVVHDFGEIAGGSKNVCEFRFTNKGNGILKVNKKVKATCGCTAPSLAKEEYAPNESGVIKVTYRSGKNPGSAAKHLYVSSNDKDNPKVKLTIKAKVVQKVKFEPQTLNLLLNDENAGCPDIKLTSLDNQPFSITRFRSVPDCITAEYDTSVKATEFTLKPKVDVEKLRQQLNGRIVINLTHPQARTITVRFNTLPKFKAEPAMLTAFNAEPQKPVRKTVYILSNYDDDFEVESVSTKNDVIKVVSREKVGNRYKLEVDLIPPPIEDNKRHFGDVLTVNIKDGGKLEIKCVGVYSKDQG